MGFDASSSAAMDVVILSNGPGELVTWVRPVVVEVRRQLPQARISLILVPCAHASGHERQMAQDYLRVDRIQDADFFNAFLLTGQTEERWLWAPRGVVLFLGGDQFFALWIARRLGYRTVVYVEHEARWRPWVDAFGVRTAKIQARYGRHNPKMVLVGDLMHDGVLQARRTPTLVLPGWFLPTPATRAEPIEIEKPNPESDTGITRPRSSTAQDKTLPQPILADPPLTEPLPKPGETAKTLPQLILSESDSTQPHPLLNPPTDDTKPEVVRPALPRSLPYLPRGWMERQTRGRATFQIALLPGSKAAKLSILVPFFLNVADELRRILPNVQFVIPVAPGLKLETLANYAQVKLNADIDVAYGSTATVEHSSAGVHLVTAGGTPVSLWPAFPPYTLFSHCDLCLTTVGANTAELSYLGVPMVVVLPINRLDVMRSWDGIPGILARLPLVGTVFAKLINWIALRTLGLLAWPNIWAGREVVPERRGHLFPMSIAKLVADLLRDPQRLNHIRADLEALHTSGGAAEKLVDVVVQQMAKAKPRFRAALSAKS
ncbi:MAG: hypothetical protein OHK0012_01060 [Synechococcales cyanobacterium]